MENAVADYRLLTIWRIEAPLEQVYAAIRNSPRWPDWWPAVQKVEQLNAGGADGIDSVWRYSWQGPLPYRLVFDVRATRIEKWVAIEGVACGDLEGVGRWQFSRQGSVSVVHYEWHVRSNRWWMNLFPALLRPLFIRNHGRLMEQGGEALARLLRAPLVGQENIDLMAGAAPSANSFRPRRESGRIGIDLAMVLVSGLAAGVLATVAQLVLWWLAGIPLADSLFRDARLTAALVMGRAVLPPPTTPQWDILLVATLIHFTLSVAYAVIAAQLFRGLRTGPALLAGAFYGLSIYVVNLYGFTLLFPWFTQVRDWVTLAAHLVFGVVLVAGCRLFQPGGGAAPAPGQA